MLENQSPLPSNSVSLEKSSQNSQRDTINESSLEEKSKLSYWAIFFITVNSVMGTGIFFLPAIASRELGLFSIISWLIMGFIAIYFSMMFAELVGLFPKEGGIYEYAKMAFGPFISFIVGWLSLVAANVAIAMLIVGGINYIGPFLPDTILIIVSIIFVILFNYMAFKGLKTSSFMLLTFSGITLLALLGVIVPGILNFQTINFTGWFTHQAVSTISFSLPGLATLAGLIFFGVFIVAETFFGWESSTFLAEKVRNARTVMPKVMVRSTILIVIITLLFVIASISIIGWQAHGSTITPLILIAQAIYGSGLVNAYTILVYLALMGAVAGWIVAAPNLVLALAKDNLFIPQLSKIHPKTKTPHRAILFQTILTSILIIVGAGNYEVLQNLLVPLFLLLYAGVVISLLIIRKKHPEIEKPYTAPLGTTGPVILLLIIFSLIIIWSLTHPLAPMILSIILGVFIIGLPLFLLLFFYYDPVGTLRFKNSTSTISFIFERIFFPRIIQKRLIANAQITNNVVLELGASSGLISQHIAKQHPKKQIIIEQTQGLKHLLEKRIKHSHELRVIIDEHIISRIHPDVKKVDEVFSFGLLTELQNPSSFLKELSNHLSENSRIHFFDYVDFYKFIPNKELVSDLAKLKDLFKSAGFAVSIEKKKGLFWNYLIIDGIKTSNPDAVYI